MDSERDDLALDDAAFLEAIARGLANVKVRPKGETASEISHANAGTRQFRERAIRLQAIARRLRNKQ